MRLLNSWSAKNMIELPSYLAVSRGTSSSSNRNGGLGEGGRGGRGILSVLTHTYTQSARKWPPLMFEMCLPIQNALEGFLSLYEYTNLICLSGRLHILARSYCWVMMASKRRLQCFLKKEHIAYIHTHIYVSIYINYNACFFSFFRLDCRMNE